MKINQKHLVYFENDVILVYFHSKVSGTGNKLISGMGMGQGLSKCTTCNIHIHTTIVKDTLLPAHKGSNADPNSQCFIGFNIRNNSMK